MYKIISRASSANMGAGFDCLGVCLSMENTFTFSEYEDAVIINNHADTIRNRNNLVIKSMYTAFEILGKTPPSGVKLDVRTVVPLSRGLGSSATCASAGVAAAFMFSGIIPDKSQIFEITTQIEGHPDNAAANIFGGATLSYIHDNQYKFMSFGVNSKYFFIAMIPDFKLSTAKAREVLPLVYSRSDAVFNITRAAMTINALENGNNELLTQALDDRMHQQFRSPLIKGYDAAVMTALEAGAIGTYLSGAGPTIMAIADNEEVYKKIVYALRQMEFGWQTELLRINYDGLECFKTK